MTCEWYTVRENFRALYDSVYSVSRTEVPEVTSPSRLFINDCIPLPPPVPYLFPKFPTWSLDLHWKVLPSFSVLVILPLLN